MKVLVSFKDSNNKAAGFKSFKTTPKLNLSDAMDTAIEYIKSCGFKLNFSGEWVSKQDGLKAVLSLKDDK